MTCYSGLTAGWVGWANTVRWQIESTWKESPAPFGGRKSPSNIQAIVVWEIWFHVFPHFTDISPNNAVMMYGKTRRSISCPETSDKMESSYLTAEQLEASYCSELCAYQWWSLVPNLCAHQGEGAHLRIGTLAPSGPHGMPLVGWTRSSLPLVKEHWNQPKRKAPSLCCPLHWFWNN